MRRVDVNLNAQAIKSSPTRTCTQRRYAGLISLLLPWFIPPNLSFYSFSHKARPVFFSFLDLGLFIKYKHVVMRHSDSLYYFEDGYCGGCGLTDRGLPCAAAECLFLTCGDEECDDGASFFTYDDDSTVATNYTDADTLTLSSRSVMTKGFPRRGVGGYSNYRKDGVGDRISQRLQKIDERNEALEMEPMTTGLSCLSAAADHGNASNIPMTIAPLPTVEEGSEEREITAVEPMMHGGEASAASKSGSGTVIPHSNTMFSARSAKSSKSTKTEKTSTSARSFPGALMVAKAGTKLRSAKLPDVKMPEAKLKQRMLALHMATMGLASPRPKQQRKATGIIGANGGSVEVVDLDRRNDRAVKQDTCATKVPSLFGGEIDISDERDSFAGVDTSTSENGKMTTMKTASGAMGSALTVLNVKKMKTRHDTVKRANAIEVEARKYSDRKLRLGFGIQSLFT